MPGVRLEVREQLRPRGKRRAAARARHRRDVVVRGRAPLALFILLILKKEILSFRLPYQIETKLTHVVLNPTRVPF